MVFSDPEASLKTAQAIFYALRSIVYARQLVKEFIAPIWERREEKRELRRCLFGSLSSDVYADPGRAHPYLHKGYFHPYDKVALNAVFNVIYGTSEKKRELHFVEEVGYINPSQNLCSIGNPVSNISSRTAMGYSDNLGEPPKTGLPFVFYLDEKELSKVNRYVEGKPMKIPNWSIFDKSNNKLYIPDLDTHDYLTKDYLLITLMPNRFSKEGNKNHAIFAGTHSTGTAAVRNLLNNLEILREIDKKREESKHFQSLIKVTKVKYTKDGWCMPVELEHIKTIPL